MYIVITKIKSFRFLEANIDFLYLYGIYFVGVLWGTIGICKSPEKENRNLNNYIIVEVYFDHLKAYFDLDLEKWQLYKSYI